MAERVGVLAAVRTPIGRFLGGLAHYSAAELGTFAVKSVLDESGIDPGLCDEVIFGNARQAGGGPNVARQVAIRSGLSQSVPAFTVNHACASGLKSLQLAQQAIEGNAAHCIIAGGAESMSRVPFLLPGARDGFRLGSVTLEDGMYRDGFHCPLADQVMGETAETLASQYGISRDEQDAYAARSQNRAEAARNAGRFDREIRSVPGKKGEPVSADEHPRAGVTPESLAKLKPVFRSDGTVTAGNSSGITDGGAALVLVSEAFAKAHGVEVLAWMGHSAVTGVDPKIMGIGPVSSTNTVLERAGMKLEDVDLVELNEAFAAQVLAVGRNLDLDWERVNVSGGAISLGHPIGCTGARIAVTLVHDLVARSGETGMATLCVSGGQGMSTLFHRN